MDLKVGDIVKHKLTGEKLLVVKVNPGSGFVIECRKLDYDIVRLSADELEKVD